MGLMILLWSTKISAQRFEMGPSIGITTILNDQINSLENTSSLGAGLIFKYNTNKRWSYRFSYSYLPTKINLLDTKNHTTIQELTAGIEFNFFDYQVPHKSQNSTPYLIIQLSINYFESIDEVLPPLSLSTRNNIAFGIPLGIGYKTKVFSNIALAIESRAQYLLNDRLDPGFSQVNSRNDWYIYTGFSLQYTFGRDKCYTTPRW